MKTRKRPAKPQARNISKRKAGYATELRDKRKYRNARQAMELS